LLRKHRLLSPHRGHADDVVAVVDSGAVERGWDDWDQQLHRGQRVIAPDLAVAGERRTVDLLHLLALDDAVAGALARVEPAPDHRYPPAAGNDTAPNARLKARD